MHTRYSHEFIYEPTILYRIVFGMRWVRFTAMLLFVFFTIHPATQALGAQEVDVDTSAQEVSEEAVEAAPAETEVAVVPENPEVPEEEIAAETEVLVAEQASETNADALVQESDEPPQENVDPVAEDQAPVVLEEDIQNDTDTVPDLLAASSSDDAIEVEPTQEAVSTSSPASLDAVVLGSATSTDQVDIEQSTSSAPVVGSGTSVPAETTSSDDRESVTATDDTSDNVPETESPAEEVVAPAESVEGSQAEEEINEVEVDTVVPAPEYFEIDGEVSHSDAHYQFQKTQCVSMGDGGYYCAKKQLQEPQRGEEDSLYAAMDAQGDMEIYLRTDGVIKQITDNSYDDAAPYYDSVSDSIVWHRLINGRYQIMSFAQGEETQLTSSRNNSMEPKRSGDYTVWQEWISDNWEIMLHDGVATEQLTSDTMQDVAPYVQGAHIIWTTTDGGQTVISVYDIATKRTSVIEDSDGGRVENPRFVLVYDEKLDNGDIITKGFNPDTGEVAPLSAQAGTVPADLPSSDSTGETRALIQNKPGAREDFSEEIEIGAATSTNDIATTSDDVVIDGNLTLETEDAVSTSTITVDEEILELNDFDIIVEPFSASTSAQQTDTATSTDAVE